MPVCSFSASTLRSSKVFDPHVFARCAATSTIFIELWLSLVMLLRSRLMRIDHFLNGHHLLLESSRRRKTSVYLLFKACREFYKPVYDCLDVGQPLLQLAVPVFGFSPLNRNLDVCNDNFRPSISRQLETLDV